MKTYKDIDIELSKQTDGDVKMFLDTDAIKSSIINILTTRIGTRRMVPEFGSDLDYLLFEPMDKYTAERIASSILRAINTWEDRIIVDNVNIDVSYDLMYYKATISYTIKGKEPRAEEITFILRKI